MLSLKYVFSGSVFVIQTSNDRTFYLKNGLIMWTTNFSPDWPEGVANQRRRSQSEGRKSWRKMWEIAVWIKLKWGRLKESGSQTPHWEKTSRVSKPWGRFSALKSERRQCPSLNTKSKSLCAPPCQKLTQYWGALKGFEKASEVSSCPPTDATMREQLFELESVLSESSHVCPTDWMSCIRKGGGGDWRLCSR